MNESEVRRFMQAGSKTGKLATVRADGRPHVKPIWFDFDEETGDVVFLTWHSTVAARNIERDPRVSILVDEEQMPFAWARLDGVASVHPDDARKLYWATETCRRYVGDDRAEEYGRRNGVDGEVVVRVRPMNMVGQSDLAD
jgi:PPOX class probable F420-dependent enzyme